MSPKSLTAVVAWAALAREVLMHAPLSPGLRFIGEYVPTGYRRRIPEIDP